MARLDLVRAPRPSRRAPSIGTLFPEQALVSEPRLAFSASYCQYKAQEYEK